MYIPHQTTQKNYKLTIKTIFTCMVINTFAKLYVAKTTCHTCYCPKME